MDYGTSYIKITENGAATCCATQMAKNIPGMLRILSEALAIYDGQDTLTSDILVRLGAWSPLDTASWERLANKAVREPCRDSVMEIDADEYTARLSDWFISSGRTEVSGNLIRLADSYKFALENGKLNQEQFARNLFSLGSVEIFEHGQQKDDLITMSM